MDAPFVSRRDVKRRRLVPTVLAGFVVLLAATALVRADDGPKTRNGDAATSKAPAPPPLAEARDAAPDDDKGPPGSPRDDRDGRPGPPRPEGRRGGQDPRQSGPGGAPNRPDFFGPGRPNDDMPRGPRQDRPSFERDDPEMFKLIKAENNLNRRTEELARNCRHAPEDQRAKLKDELLKALTEQFQIRQQRRKLELTRFEEELKRLRDASDRREKNKQQIIEKRASELLGEEGEAGF